MRKFVYAVFLPVLITSCLHVDSAKKDLTIPQIPTSIEEAKNNTKNKNFVVEEVGTINLFHEYDWSSSDTSKFYTDYIAERKAFALHFLNDSAATINDDKKIVEAIYDIEKDTGTSLILNLHYMDSTFSFNPGEATRITSTYKIHGLDDNRMLVETPRELNRRKVVLLMKTK